MRHFSTLLVFVFAFCLTAEARVRHMEKGMKVAAPKIQFSISNFQSSIIKGDANGDGQVNISDAVLLVNNVLGSSDNGLIVANCDMNSDGYLNVSDVALIVKMIMEGDSTMGPGDAEDPDVNGN